MRVNPLYLFIRSRIPFYRHIKKYFKKKLELDFYGIKLKFQLKRLYKKISYNQIWKFIIDWAI